MKSTRIFVQIAASLLYLAVLTSTSFAVTHALSIPRGMAVDATGNLWVANAGANNVLVFSSTYKLLASETITAGVVEPTGVAFDSLGNLWVTNYLPGTINEYTGGVLNPGATITIDGGPEAIAIDGLDNVWIASYEGLGGQALAVYEPTQVYGPANNSQMNFGPYPSVFYGIAVSGGELIWGDGNELNFTPATVALTTGAINGTSVGGSNSATYLATAANGTIYFATQGNLLNYALPGNPVAAFSLLELPFAPTGIAVDSVHNRIYVANGYGNSISVYNTVGRLLHTIN